jgi:hypothetical protein
MAEPLDALIFDFVEWVARAPRSHGEVLEAWRTSCPRLTVWEDAAERGYVARKAVSGSLGIVVVTERGLSFLRENGAGFSPAVTARDKTSGSGRYC